jgi:hypothetical protein
VERRVWAPAEAALFTGRGRLGGIYRWDGCGGGKERVSYGEDEY